MAEKNLNLQKLFESLLKAQPCSEETEREHKFWNTQPVPRLNEQVNESGVIHADKEVNEIKQEPFAIQKDFEWYLVDVNDEKDLRDTYQLLTTNYVEDDDATFRFDYSAEFLKWALQPPGWKRDWHVAIRVAKTKKLVAFISAVPANIRVDGPDAMPVVEINFLCIHKKLRSKRLAPIMIKEVTRRVNLHGIFQAVYTAGVKLPKPVSTARYYHRTLNAKKLVEIGFTSLGRDMTMAKMIKKYNLPDEPLIDGLRPMIKEDVGAVTTILNNYLQRFRFAPMLNQEEVKHWLMPVDSVIYSYVVQKPDQPVTDFISFYSLPSTISGNNLHNKLEAAYLFYYVPSDMGVGKERTEELITDALILANKAGFDVFNCLELAQNGEMVEELLFGPGNGFLNYYLFNYRCPDVDPSQLSLVML